AGERRRAEARGRRNRRGLGARRQQPGEGLLRAEEGSAWPLRQLRAAGPRGPGARGGGAQREEQPHADCATRMTPDLPYLAFTALRTAALWIPYVVAQVSTNGFLRPPNYVDPTARPVPLWGRRADRAHLNAVEAFAPFAALVLIAHVTGKANGATAFCS